jgi:hypothetical protein
VDGARHDRHEYGERYGDAADPWARAAEVTRGVVPSRRRTGSQSPYEDSR